jgi:hypothetical protein
MRRSPAIPVVASALLLASSLGLTLTQWAPAAEPQTKTVRLVIDYGDGVETHFKALPHRAEMTALDALKAAEKHRRGVKTIYQGTGKNALITQIGDVKNEGGSGAGRNWTFRVNGELADVGAGAYTVKPGDVILWQYGVYVVGD